MQSGDIKIGMTLEVDNGIYTVVDCQRVQQPRLASFTRAKIKNVETGQVLERNFRANEQVNTAQVEKKEMQYLYTDEEFYYFMDLETFEQTPLNKKDVANALQYITENMNVWIHSVKGRIIDVVPPLFVDLLIVECEPAVVGDSARNVTKPATVETGLKIKVPMFVDNGEKIKIDTRTGTYVERVK